MIDEVVVRGRPIVIVQDVLPAGLTATTIGGAGWSCTLATLTCTRADGLAPTASFPFISLTVNVAANAPPSVVNTATVANAGDLNPANDVTTDPTTITAVAPDPITPVCQFIGMASGIAS